MMIEIVILVIGVVLVFVSTLRMETECSPLLLYSTGLATVETVILRCNQMLFNFTRRRHFEDNFFNTLSLVLIFHVNFNIYRLVLFPLLSQLLLYRYRQMVLSVSLAILFLK